MRRIIGTKISKQIDGEVALKETINNFIKIELLAAAIYSEFSCNSNSDEELKAIWLQMARDEEDHANALTLALRLPQTEVLLREGEHLPSPEASIGTLSSILAQAKSHSCSKHKMLSDAVFLEKMFRKIHSKYVLEFENQSLHTTFLMLARDDEEHIERLKKFIEKYKLGIKAK